jgi:hypothetical protein
MDCPTSFWSHPDGHTVRVLYSAPVCWENTLMADIDLATLKVEVLYGSQVEDRHKIAKFTIEISTGGNSYRKLSRIGNDAQTLSEVLDVLEGFGNEYRLLKIHAKAALDCRYHYADASYLALDEVRRQIEEIYDAEAYGLPKSAFYCGTTSDLDIKMEWHRHHDFEIAEDIVHAWVCATIQNAEKVKQWAGQEGFDTTESKAPPYEEIRRAAIVYLLKKA